MSYGLILRVEAQLDLEMFEIGGSLVVYTRAKMLISKTDMVKHSLAILLRVFAMQILPPE